MKEVLREAAAVAAGWAADPPWWVAAVLALAAVALLVRYLKRAVPALVAQRDGITTAHVVITGAVGTAAVVLVGFAFAMSYSALYVAATWLEHTPFGDLRWMFPIGIDITIVFFLVLDLVMEWQGRPHPLARWSAYGLSAITVAVQVGQTAPGEGLVGALGHAGPPVVIVLISEAVAAWVRHMAGMLHGDLPDRIPAGRWIAQPLSTLLVARLMLGWGVTSYKKALQLESARQLARSMLRQQYGRAWRRRTPRHVLWMLANGRDLPTALELVDAYTPAVPKTAAQARALQHEDAAGHRPSPAAPALSRLRDAARADEAGGDGWTPQEVLSAEAEQLAAEAETYLSGRDVSGWDTPADAGTGPVSPAADPGDTGVPPAADGPADEADLPWWHFALPHEEQDGTAGDQQGHREETADEGRDDTRTRVKRVLSQNPGITVRRLADAVGCSSSQAGRLRREILDEAERDADRDTGRDGRPATGGE